MSANLQAVNGKLSNQPYVAGYAPSSEDAQLYDDMFRAAPNTAKWAAQMACYAGAERVAIAAGVVGAAAAGSAAASSSSSSADALAKRLTVLESRWAAIEKQVAAAKVGTTAAAAGAASASASKAAAAAAASAASAGPEPKSWQPVAGEDPQVGRLRGIAKQMGLRSAEFYWVPSEYYDRPLSWRRDQLGAPSMQHIVKSVLLKNTHWKDTGDAIHNSEFYLVLTAYVDKLSTLAFEKILRERTGLGKKQFNLRLHTEGEELSGYGNNAIPPFGLKTNVNIPVIISRTIAELQPPIFYAGGGHVDCKFKCDLAEFVAATGAQVLDIAEPLELAQIN